MRVLTSNPIITDTYSNLDAKSTYNDILDFQQYINRTRKLGLKEDGLWGDSTATAWTMFGDSYLKDNPKKTAPAPAPAPTPAPATAPAPTTNLSSKTTKGGKMSTIAWVGIGVGVLVFGVVIYALTKSKK